MFDQNGDGVLGEREFAAAADRHFADSDTDGDGRVTIRELLSAFELRRAFSSLKAMTVPLPRPVMEEGRRRGAADRRKKAESCCE